MQRESNDTPNSAVTMGVSLKDIPAPGSWIQLEGASAQALSPRRAVRAVVMVVVFMVSMYLKI